MLISTWLRSLLLVIVVGVIAQGYVISQPGTVLAAEAQLATVDPQVYQPLALPTSSAYGQELPEPHRLIAHTPQLREVVLQPSVQFAESTQRLVATESTAGLVPVPNPEDQLFSANVKLLIDIAGEQRSCSGVLIDAEYVLTAGHCVYSPSIGWADRVVAIPAYRDGQEPFGHAVGVQMYSSQGWITGASTDWDLALIQLNRPVGAITGWLAYDDAPSSQFYATSTFLTPGYPADTPFDGDQLYVHSGALRPTQDPGILAQSRRAYAGLGGGAAYTSDRVVYAIVTHAIDSNTLGLTRIDQLITEAIHDQIGANRSLDPDLVPLQVQSEADQIGAGQAITSSVLVYNRSASDWSGQLILKFYLSPDAAIGVGDTPLHTTFMSVIIRAGEGVRYSLPPASTPFALVGRYWLGAVVASADSDPTNNATAGWDTFPLTIQPFIPAVPESLRATQSGSSHSVTVSWSTTPGAIAYELYRSSASAAAPTLLATTTSGFYDDPTAVLGQRYTYMVRAIAANGAQSGFSAPTIGYVAYQVGLPRVVR